MTEDEVYLDTIIADSIEDGVLAVIEKTLKDYEVEGATWEDFNVREFAENVALIIMEHTENRPATGSDIPAPKPEPPPP